ncbi:MAG: US12 family protein [Lachnospiraceae bacterium]|nr:US12 family protein [Lachnospiraceae bacterium]
MLGTNARREERMYKEVYVDEEISDRAYNGVIGAVLVYGLLVNVAICYIFQDRMLYVNPAVLIVGYFICCFIGMLMSSKSDNAIISFIGYNLVVVPVGLVVSVSVAVYGGLGSEMVGQAFIITMLTTATMAAVSFAKPEWFEKLGGVLLASLSGLVISEIVLLIMGSDQVITAWIGAVLFSLYIGYDFHRAQAFPKTLDNAVDSALDIYLDVINLFLKILRILGSKGGSKSRR